MPSEYIPLVSLGYFICDIPKSILDYVKFQSTKIIDSDFKGQKTFKYGLAGAIEHEYKFTTPVAEFNKFFEVIVPEYWKAQYNFYEAGRKYNIAKTRDGSLNLWINFQKKYEYNPAHEHFGALSFTGWIKIPYNLEDEADLPSNKNSSRFNGPVFSFHYPTPQPLTSNIINYDIQLDNSWEGKMIIFPSWLQHSVTPFYTSDDYRISLAGNLVPIN